MDSLQKHQTLLVYKKPVTNPLIFVSCLSRYIHLEINLYTCMWTKANNTYKYVWGKVKCTVCRSSHGIGNHERIYLLYAHKHLISWKALFTPTYYRISAC